MNWRRYFACPIVAAFAFFGGTSLAHDVRHEGVDDLSAPGRVVRSTISGTVTYLGIGFDRAAARGSGFRDVEISVDGAPYVLRWRYLEPHPSLSIGARVDAGMTIGRVQELGGRYIDIENHVHIELWLCANAPLPGLPLSWQGCTVQNPKPVFEALGVTVRIRQ